MQCSNCGHDIPSSDAPCSSTRAHERRQPKRKRRHTETFDPEVTRQALSDLYANRAKFSGKASAFMLGWAFLSYLLGLEFWVLIGLAALLPLSFYISFSMPGLNKSEYYSLPGSAFANGDHRCIHCGHRGRNGRGIYRHGEYKSNTKYADCRSCGENLFKY